jgi:hypothetical protein
MKDNRKVMMKYLYHQEWKEKPVSLGEVHRWVSEGKYQHRVEAVRNLREIAVEGGMVGGAIAAEALPMIRPAMGADGAYTGLVLLSFRLSEGLEVLEQLRSMVNLWEQTLMSFMGSSGRSLKVIIPYQLTGGGLPADSVGRVLFEQYAYKRAAEYAYHSTGIKPEEVLHDGKEGFRVSFDPQAYYNPEANPIEMMQPTEPLTDTSAQIISRSEEPSLDTNMLPGYTRREMDVTKYNFLCRDLAYGTEMDKEQYLMKLAIGCCKAGIDKELAIKLTIDQWEFFRKDILVRSTFGNAYEKHRLGMANPIERSLMHQQLLEEFLRRRYMFRRNQVTGEVEYQEKYRYVLWWKPLTEEAKNDINNEAIREGIRAWPKDLDRILMSERIKVYDPVRVWLDNLPRWDGRDRLGELADRVPTDSQGWRDNFKIWMRSMVSQWRSGKDALYGAQMVLMLVGGQGTRKSSFMRMLLPKELMPFYIDRIDFQNKKEALRALSRFLLINIDEYDQISKAQTAFLKHLIQRTDVKERKMYSTTFEQQQRYAAFCATTNSLAPLKDESGSRRYLVVEVTDKIDTDVTAEKAIDYRQLYAQIVHEIENGEEYAFTGERESRIIEQNADYCEMPNAVALFEDMFRQPQRGDEILMLTPTEILGRIKDAKKVGVVNQTNATLIGSYLHRKGYQRGHGRQRRCYQVALKM